MKFKNILAIIAISATTAIGSVWGYGKFIEHQYAGIQDPGNFPLIMLVSQVITHLEVPLILHPLQLVQPLQ